MLREWRFFVLLKMFVDVLDLLHAKYFHASKCIICAYVEFFDPLMVTT